VPPVTRTRAQVVGDAGDLERDSLGTVILTASSAAVPRPLESISVNG
jgi:hypothetical protein